MPDLSEVENVLVSLLTQIVYPNGTAADSATGDRVKIFRGWPIPGNLDADLKAGIVNLSVFPKDSEKNATRATGREWEEVPSPPVTLTMTVSGNAITVGGTPCCPLNVAVLVDGKPFVYPLQATDTPTSIATALASLINTSALATNNGPVVTVPGATRLVARVGAVGSVVQEVKRQEKGFCITAWCSSPVVRDAIAGVLDSALADLTFISLSDGTSGRIRYERTHTIDSQQKFGLYRRDFHYAVEYATTVVRKAAEMVADIVNATGDSGALSTTNA